jgi:hypothetical protein
VQSSEKDLEQAVKTNLILGIDTGEGSQGSFERTTDFGWPLRELDHSCGTPESPVKLTLLLNWQRSIRTMV